MRGIGFERQIAELVDDQQLRPGQERELPVERSIVMGLGEDRDQRRCRDELDGVVLADRLPAKSDGEMRFSRAGGTSIILPGVRLSKFGSRIRSTLVAERSSPLSGASVTPAPIT